MCSILTHGRPMGISLKTMQDTYKLIKKKWTQNAFQSITESGKETSARRELVEKCIELEDGAAHFNVGRSWAHTSLQHKKNAKKAALHEKLKEDGKKIQTGL